MDFTKRHQISELLVPAPPKNLLNTLKFMSGEKEWKWFSVSLQLFGDDLPVEEISDWLAIKASKIGRKGKPTRDSLPSALHRTNIWTWRASDDRSLSFEAQILPILDLLETKTEEWKQIK